MSIKVLIGILVVFGITCLLLVPVLDRLGEWQWLARRRKKKHEKRAEGHYDQLYEDWLKNRQK
jgi:hypothetical protein